MVLYKGGSRSDPANHRPISLLFVFSKIFEKAMLSRLLSFLDAKNYQFRFRASHSTEHACAALSNFIHSATDSGHIPEALLLEDRKAFDFLTHRILLWELSHIGIRSNAYSWFD